jgi:glycosyltransferase involved in cell wall biosynthesis
MRISIIVNVYKGTEQYLEECLESIKSQTTKPYEIILVVDGYEKPMIYPGVTAIVRDENKGIAFSRNQGFQLSTGDYILFVDADDMLAENFLEEMMAQVLWHKPDVVYPSAILLARWDDSKLDNGYFVPPHTLKLSDMAKQNYVLVTSLIKREVYEKVGGFNPDLSIFEDYEFFLKAMLIGYKFVRANCCLRYRQRTLSRNRSNESSKERIYNQIRNSVLKDVNILKFDAKNLKKAKKQKALDLSKDIV